MNSRGFFISLLFSLVMSLAWHADAQYGYYNEALLFSNTSFGGTARIQGLGGAQVALGGDLSLANSNPAGLGFYNRSVFSLTPAFYSNYAHSQYFGEFVESTKNKFLFDQVGVGFNRGSSDLDLGSYRGGTFAITINRTNDFNGQVEYAGYNNFNSLINSIVENPNTALADAAFENLLVNEHPNNYVWDAVDGVVYGFDTVSGFNGLSSPFETSVPRQYKRVTTTGGQYDIDLAYGGNFSDVFYFGAGVGIQLIDYVKEQLLVENEYFVVLDRQNGSVDGFDDDALEQVSLHERLGISGIGINAKLGMIVRPVDFLTLGISFQTPTAMGLNDSSSFQMDVEYTNLYHYTAVTLDNQDIDNDPETRYLFESFELDERQYISDLYYSSYTVVSPSRLNLGAAFFLGKYGFLSGDVEFVDYRDIQLKSKEVDMSGDNAYMEENFSSVVNYRIGGELRFDHVRVRGGYAVQQSPSPLGEDFDSAVRQISTGLGFRSASFFADLAVKYAWQDQYYSPYEISYDQPLTKVEVKNVGTLLTLGLYF